MTTVTATSAAERFRQLRSAQKKRRGVPLYTLYVNRPAGRAIAALAPASVTPNQLTAVGALLTYGSLGWLMFGATRGWSAGLVGVALVVGFFFDSADGQLARLQGAGSLRGEWLDHVLDSGRIALLHVATLFFLLRTTGVGPTWVFLTCAVFLVTAVLIFFGGILFDKLVPPSGTASPAASTGSFHRSVLMLPLDYGIVCASFVLAAWPPVFFATYLLLALAKVGAAVAFLSTWYRRLAVLDAAGRPTT